MAAGVRPLFVAVADASALEIGVKLKLSPLKFAPKLEDKDETELRMEAQIAEYDGSNENGTMLHASSKVVVVVAVTKQASINEHITLAQLVVMLF